MGWAWLPILWAIGIMLLVVLLQMKTRHLIRALRTDEGLYQQAGRPSCDYFWVSLWQWRNHDLLYWIARHASLPPHLAQDVPDYHDIRRLCRVYLW
ncbi:MAG: hypothetical protein KA214_06705 [Neisseriaceae bacterium]|nr:hypothetical protein [Neisseriaceae bacterium]